MGQGPLGQNAVKLLIGYVLHFGPNVLGSNVNGPNVHSGPNILGPNVSGPNVHSVPNILGPIVSGPYVIVAQMRSSFFMK